MQSWQRVKERNSWTSGDEAIVEWLENFSEEVEQGTLEIKKRVKLGLTSNHPDSSARKERSLIGLKWAHPLLSWASENGADFLPLVKKWKVLFTAYMIKLHSGILRTSHQACL
jgi:hypothetical protein